MEKPIILSRPQTARMSEALNKTMETLERKRIEREKERERIRLLNLPKNITGKNDLLLRKIKRKIESVLNNKKFKNIQNEEKRLELKKVKLLGKLVNLLEHSIVLSPEQVLLYKVEFQKEKFIKKNKISKKKEMKFSHNLNYFSEIGITFRYEDLYFTPTEFIQKNFTDSEKRLMVLDPKYFLLHKPPFDKVDLKLKYSLTSKIEEEENIRKIFEKKKNSLSNEKKRNSIFYPVLKSKDFNNNYLTLDSEFDSFKSRNNSSKKRCVTASTRPISANNNINVMSLNKKKNFDFFNQKKKEIKFIHVPKIRIKKKIENRTFEDFQRRKQLIQDEKQYFRKKKVNYYQEIKEKNQREILKELESKKDIRDILNEIEKNYFENKYLK